MKVTFSKTVPYTPTWRGNTELPEEEQVKCVLQVLELNELLSLVDSFNQAGLEGEVDTDSVDLGTMKPIVTEFAHLLPARAEIKGVFDSAGEAVSVEDIVKYPVFLNLALEILMKLAEISSPNEDDVKN